MKASAELAAVLSKRKAQSEVIDDARSGWAAGRVRQGSNSSISTQGIDDARASWMAANPGNVGEPFLGVIGVTDDDVGSLAPTVATRNSSRVSTSRGHHVDRVEYNAPHPSAMHDIALKAPDRNALVARVEAQTVLYTTVCELRGEVAHLQTEMRNLSRRNCTLDEECIKLRAAESRLRPEIAELQESKVAKDCSNQSEMQECYQLRSETRRLQADVDIVRQREVWAENQWQQRHDLLQSEHAAARQDATAWHHSCIRQREAEVELEMAVAQVTDKAAASFSEERERIEILNRGLENRIAHLKHDEQTLRWEISEERQRSESIVQKGKNDVLEQKMESETQIAQLKKDQSHLRNEAMQVVARWDQKLKSEAASALKVESVLRRQCDEYSHAADHFLMEEQRLAQDNQRMHRNNAELQEKAHNLRDLKEQADRAAADASNRLGQLQHRLEVTELVHRQESSVREAEFKMKLGNRAQTRDMACQCDMTTAPRTEPEPSPPVNQVQHHSQVDEAAKDFDEDEEESDEDTVVDDAHMESSTAGPLSSPEPFSQFPQATQLSSPVRQSLRVQQGIPKQRHSMMAPNSQQRLATFQQAVDRLRQTPGGAMQGPDPMLRRSTVAGPARRSSMRPPMR